MNEATKNLLYATMKANGETVPGDFTGEMFEETQTKLQSPGMSAEVMKGIIDGTITEIEADWESIRDGMFSYCKHLTHAKFPNATTVGEQAFQDCHALENVYLPNVVVIKPSTFVRCNALRSINLPKVTELSLFSFEICGALEKVDLPVCIHFAQYALDDCANVRALILRSNSLCTIDASNALPSSIKAGTGYVYVPRALVNSYKTAANWSTYANQFRALEDYTVDGTITGELDPNKI